MGIVLENIDILKLPTDLEDQQDLDEKRGLIQIVYNNFCLLKDRVQEKLLKCNFSN